MGILEPLKCWSSPLCITIAARFKFLMIIIRVDSDTALQCKLRSLQESGGIELLKISSMSDDRQALISLGVTPEESIILLKPIHHIDYLCFESVVELKASMVHKQGTLHSLVRRVPLLALTFILGRATRRKESKSSARNVRT